MKPLERNRENTLTQK